METRVPAGNVWFLIDPREGAPNGGPSITVWAAVDGRDVQLLRFDCFHRGPHYHYDPGGRNERHQLDDTRAADSIGWTLSRLRGHLGPMIEEASYPSVAQALDALAIERAVADVADHLLAERQGEKG